eukprot:CAMPEP_0119481186 /NCGR_PEP_ID=MMETSP1344-20130328/9649_1 /TAXON_ID=236787 /ORGANISM="Florenciella parvula, Strain CCMP2471" /LENGTH=414 /DNA_ID=CAMNT_0007515553 /DNA_START=325 /DNA_END=1570 /DNA_ORIENTATION=+
MAARASDYPSAGGDGSASASTRAGGSSSSAYSSRKSGRSRSPRLTGTPRTPRDGGGGGGGGGSRRTPPPPPRGSPPPHTPKLKSIMVAANKEGAKAESHAVPLTIPKGTSFQTFRQLAGEALRINHPAKVFLRNGTEVWQINDIRSGDLCFISSGEPFYNKGGPRSSRLNVAVLGTPGVGKSALTQQFIHGSFVAYHDPTIEDRYRKTVFVDNRQDQLEILDTAGQDEFTQYRHQWMRDKDAYIFVFSLTNKQSLHELDAYAVLHYQQNSTNAVTPPVLLVGSKKDLVENGVNRQVSVAEAQQSLGRWRDMFRNSDVRLGQFFYLETSSKTGENVDRAFDDVVREIRRCRTGHVSMYGGRPKEAAIRAARSSVRALADWPPAIGHAKQFAQCCKSAGRYPVAGLVYHARALLVR